MAFLRFPIMPVLFAWTVSILASLNADSPRNVVFILSDDHRYDLMGFMDKAPEWLETPHLDRLAAEGAHVKNAFLSTSLCSPSRASILTGQYMRRHRVVDNQRAVPEGTVFFPATCSRPAFKRPSSASGTWGTTMIRDARVSITGSASSARDNTSIRL